MDVLRVRDVGFPSLKALLTQYGLTLIQEPDSTPITGSFWNEDEAGIVGLNVYVRADTPIHSLLHEASHTICMDDERRHHLHTDAGGDYEEEDAVCYLQICLANAIPPMNQERMQHDMDAWGYTFRLGSAKLWFEQDAEDARTWLIHHNLLTQHNELIFNLRS